MDICAVKPLTKQAIEEAERLRAKCILLEHLRQIPEFVELWERARSYFTPIAECVCTTMKKQFSSLSAGARGAIIFSSGTSNDIKEAQGVVEFFSHFKALLEEQPLLLKCAKSYLTLIEMITQPLGIHGFNQVLIMADNKSWGSNEILAGPLDSFSRNILESQILESATDLSPLGLSQLTNKQILRRAEKKIAPLKRRMRLYLLDQRIHFWVRNKVYGENQEQIAECLAGDLGWDGQSNHPISWVKKQIRDVNHLLDIKTCGRPPKGGALRQWKLMTK